MAEIKAQVEQVVGAVEKAIGEQGARFEAAAAEVTKLQQKGFAQTAALIDDVVRITRDQVAFAEQIGGEWRKVFLASTKSATQLFAPKA